MWLTFFHIMETLVIILDSSMVEHSAVNRVVVGSSPTRGVLSTALRKFGYQRIGIYARRYLGLSGLIVYYQAALSVNNVINTHIK